jgi:lysophospholipase L1-like esterase
MTLHIFFFGDSICFGQFISPHKVWINRISEELHKIEDKIIVFNPSHSGDTTRMALENMPFDVQGHGVDIILIQFGINDSNYWLSDGGLPRVSPKAYEANLLEIIERAKTFGAKHIFLDTNHPTNKTVIVNSKEIPHQLGNSRYNEIIRKVAKESGVQLIDIENAKA